MDIAIRSATGADFGEIAALDATAFGMNYEDQDLTDVLTVVDPERFLVAITNERIVGVTGDYPFEMTVPGGRLQVPGVTWVSVSPTHRRRGVLTELMRHQIGRYAESGVALAVLMASEGGIYGRFGYGPAGQTRKTVVDRRRARLAQPPHADRVQVATATQARAHAPEVHRRWRALVPGALSRSEAWWDLLFLDRGHHRGGMTSMFFLTHPDGYVSYRVKSDWANGHPSHTCWITDYLATTEQAHAELWEVLLGMDLFGRIESFQIPIDDPLPFLLSDFRQVRTEVVNDGLWARPIDVSAALSARTYGVEVDAVLEVVDDLLGDGRYRLSGGPDGATCTRTDRSPDLAITASALGSVYLGGHRLRTLCAAGRAQVEDQAVARRLDRALLGDRAPIHGTAF